MKINNNCFKFSIDLIMVCLLHIIDTVNSSNIHHLTGKVQKVYKIFNY